MAVQPPTERIAFGPDGREGRRRGFGARALRHPQHPDQQGQSRHFLVSLTFLLLIDALGRSGTFFFYAAIGLLTLWFCWKLVPETKGKRLEEIEDIFKERAARSAG